MGQLLSVAGDKDDNRPGNLLGVFRRKVLGVFPGAFSGRFRGEVLGVFRRDVQGNKISGLIERKATRHAADNQGLAGFLATPTMIIARPILMRSPPAGPPADQRRRGGSRPDEARQQVTHF